MYEVSGKLVSVAVGIIQSGIELFALIEARCPFSFWLSDKAYSLAFLTILVKLISTLNGLVEPRQSAFFRDFCACFHQEASCGCADVPLWESLITSGTC
jgi:hypothetical protein